MGDTLVEQMEEFKVPKKAVKRKMVDQTEKEDSNMDTESIESGVLSGVEGTLPKAKAAFPPIKREKLADGSEVRKIPVPSHRYTPLKENWMKIFEPIVEHLKMQVRFNLKTRNVEVRTCKDTEDVTNLQKAADFVRAFIFGFEVEDALALVRLDDLFIDSFEIQDVKTLKGDHLARAIGRVAGKGGRTKYTVENVTKTRIVLADSKIHILGSYQNIAIARRALCNLILGSPPSKVYGTLRTVAARSSESPTSPLLAVARSDSTVEVWSTKHTLVLQRIIHPEPHTESVSVESLAWGGDRLYSCGLHGQVVEYDLERLCEARRHAVTSGPAWCLAIDKGGSKMAVGTEEGFVCLFNITGEGLDYNRVLDRQEGRILCLAWHCDGVHIATGSTDTIRVWNIETGHPTARMTTGRAERNKETIVWCVAITSDMTVISGDSRGKTSFWNGKNGTLMDSVQSHKADVLTLTVSGNETTAYSSGVDPTLMHFQVIVKGDGRRKWVKSLHRVISTHDVRSVVSIGDTLYSGGVDSYLSVSSYPTHRTTVKVPNLPSPGCVSLARQARSVLLSFRDRLELWRLGSTSYSSAGIGAVLPLDTEPVKVVEVGVKQGEVVVCSAVHTSGEWMAYSTTARVRLLKVEGIASGRPKLRRIAVPDEDVAHHMVLYSVGEEVRLLVCPRDGGINVYSVSDEGVSLLHSATSSELSLAGGIAKLSHTGTVCVLADFTDAVVCLDLETHSLASKLPGYTEATLASMGINFDGKTCVMVYSNNRMMEVDLKTGRYTQFSKDLSTRLPRGWLSRRTAVTNVVHIDGNSDIILLHDHSILATVDKDKELPEPSSKLFYSDPRSTPDTLTDTASVSSFGSQQTVGSRMDQTLASGLRMSRKYDHLLSLHHLAGDEIVAVEVKPGVLEGQLPPSLKQKKFGGS